MAIIKAFRAVRPNVVHVKDVAALPYDVYSREEARKAVSGKPLSFLNIDRPETQFPEGQDIYATETYQKARDMLRMELKKGIFEREEMPCFYVYELTMDGRGQTGLVALSAIDDYLSGVVKRHENTTEDKEMDRIRHVDVCSAQTGPIFLAYRRVEEISCLIDEIKKEQPLYDFLSDDGISHRVWRVSSSEKVSRLEDLFSHVPATYIADGHHRAASAVKVGLKRRASKPDFTGNEEFNFFLSVLFPDTELKILPYNRIVKDLNGLTPETFLSRLRESFYVHELPEETAPRNKGEISMYLSSQGQKKNAWYLLKAREELVRSRSGNPVSELDVSLLQDEVLEPILGIENPRKDSRIEFSGGIRGLSSLSKRVDELSGDGRAEGNAVAFAMFPTSITELLATADAGLLMPPKSTWFEPKLRSGIFIHEIEE